jgi:Uroporphyrinogen-III synthase
LCLDQEGSSSIRCYCVGPATAEQARKKGFTDIVTAGGNYQQLKETILNLSNKTEGKFLYLRGEYISNDLEKDLTDEGYRVDSFVNYTTFPNPDFDQQTLQIFKDQNIDLIFIYSKRSAEHLLKLILNNHLESKCNLIQLRCISENIFYPLQKVKWKNIKMFSPGNEELSLD